MPPPICWPRRPKSGASWSTKALPMRSPTLSLAAQAGQERLLVLRSFGKFYGLAGVRLGFVLGSAADIAALARHGRPLAGQRCGAAHRHAGLGRYQHGRAPPPHACAPRRRQPTPWPTAAGWQPLGGMRAVPALRHARCRTRRRPGWRGIRSGRGSSPIPTAGCDLACPGGAANGRALAQALAGIDGVHPRRSRHPVAHPAMAPRRAAFPPDPVDEAVLDRLRTTMDCAPSVGNARPWRVIRVDDTAPARRGARQFPAHATRRRRSFIAGRNTPNIWR